MEASNDNAINGSAAALSIDRAVGELRRGRAIRIVGTGSPQSRAGLVVAAVETVQAPLVRRLEQAGGPLLLCLTPERARAARIAESAERAVVIELPPGTALDAARALAAGVLEPGATRFERIDTDPEHAELAEAGFRLAKTGRLLPALVAASVPDDTSVLSVAIDDVALRERPARRSLKLVSQSRVPLADAQDATLVLFRDEHGLGEHIAVLIGSPDPRNVVPVRLHSACLTGDLLGSLRCDCGEQLRTAVRRIAELGGGALLYLDQEGRGIGLANKLRAYALQDGGLDTIDADRHLGFLDDERTYDVAAAMLEQLGITRIELLTNNPQKIAALRAHGIDVVGRVPLRGTANSHNARYLRAKRERAGHLE